MYFKLDESLGLTLSSKLCQKKKREREKYRSCVAWEKYFDKRKQLLVIGWKLYCWWRARNNNRYDRKNEPTIFLPSGVHTKPKPKTNPKLIISLFLGLGLVLRLVLGFVLVVYSAGQKYRWLLFLVVLVILLVRHGSGMGRPTTIHLSLIFGFFKCLPFRVCLAYSSETWLYH